MLVRKACDINVQQYGRSKFVEQRVDFWAPDKIGRKHAEMALFVVVRYTQGRSERDSRGVL